MTSAFVRAGTPLLVGAAIRSTAASFLVVALVALTIASPPAIEAQQPLPRPAGWRVRVDGAVRDTVHYVQMPPGWHMTTGPGALLYDPSYRASGRFAIEAEIFLFPGTSQSGYGVFVGGADLEGPSPRYLTLLVRRDGQAALEQVAGETRHYLMPWTTSSAVKAHPGGDETSRNVVRLSVERDSIVLAVNGSRIGAVSIADQSVDGTFGFRAGSDVNLHASRLDHTIHLAPVPPPRPKAGQ